jgi:stage II sporulation protein D
VSRRVLVAVSAFVLAAPTAASATPQAIPASPSLTPPVMVVYGRGWGHGIGMSQYGALGLARRGTVYDRILAHYYPGTTLGPAPVSTVRVLLATGVRSLRISSTSDFKVRDASGLSYLLAAGTQTLGPGLKVKVKDGTKAEALPGPLQFSGTGAALSLNGRPYRGSLQVHSKSGTLQAINVVGLEAYLYGVVPAEVPHTWPAEALKAQAVAARSYALSHRKSGLFDMYADTRSQVYRGILEEEAQTNAAVAATAGQVLLYRSQVARTYFHSTSGGRTATITDVWPNAEPAPYLVSVKDPYDSLSPHHQWGPFVYTAKELQKKLGVTGRLVDVTTVANASARVNFVTATSVLGQKTLAGADVRIALGLRSSWFRIGVLSIARPPTTPAVYGSRVLLTGIARGLGKVVLEQRAAGEEWTPVRTFGPAPDGGFSVSVTPRVTTEYRVVAGEARTATVKVPVAPLVRFSAAAGVDALRGLVRPKLPGVPVAIQRLHGAFWKRVTTASVSPNGAFEARLELVPGTYRARTRPARGFVAGTSKVLRVLPV